MTIMSDSNDTRPKRIFTMVCIYTNAGVVLPVAAYVPIPKKSRILANVLSSDSNSLLVRFPAMFRLSSSFS